MKHGGHSLILVRYVRSLSNLRSSPPEQWSTQGRSISDWGVLGTGLSKAESSMVF
jgi:hypothetical protein